MPIRLSVAYRRAVRHLMRLGGQYGFVAPAVAILAAVLVYPMAWVLWASVGGTELRLGDFTSYRLVLESGDFLGAAWRSVVYTAGSVAAKLLLGMGAALLLNGTGTGRRVARSVLFLPWTVPLFATGIAFLWLLRLGGGMERILASLGLRPVMWLGPDLALVSAMIANVWKGFPFFMVGILAALQAIPSELYEAASVDGASGVQRLRYITLPGIAPTAIVLSTLSTLWTFAQFDIIYLLTGGGPGSATTVLSILVYKTAFHEYAMERASVIAVLSLPLFVLPLALLVYLLRRR